ncbi:MAG TPA: hypothetical protein VLA51_01055, partial [Paracoccaceae bacterium]|nr:hypothetical protein [Paracoccaceae bacterium]
MSTALAFRPKDTPIALMEHPRKGMTKLQKATVIIRLLMNEGASPDLRALGDRALKNVVDTMATFGEVDKPTINAIVLEFLEELNKFGVSMRGTIEDALTNLQGHVSEEVLAKIRADLKKNPRGNPWNRVETAAPEKLASILKNENPRVAAIALSKISSDNAAEVLAYFDDDQAAAILVSISKITEISPKV